MAKGVVNVGLLKVSHQLAHAAEMCDYLAERVEELLAEVDDDDPYAAGVVEELQQAAENARVVSENFRERA